MQKAVNYAIDIFTNADMENMPNFLAKHSHLYIKNFSDFIDIYFSHASVATAVIHNSLHAEAEVGRYFDCMN